MMSMHDVFLILAMLLCLIQALAPLGWPGPPYPWRVHLGWLGMAFFFAALAFGHVAVR